MNLEDYNEYYIQGSDYYLIPKDVFKELFNEMANWKEESQRQKEVIDKAIEYINNHLKQDMLSDFTGANYIQEYISEPDKLLDILNEVE